MKIEICENTFWLALWSVIVLGVVTMAWMLTAYHNQRTLSAFAAGYQETTIAGSAQTVWTKAKP